MFIVAAGIIICLFALLASGNDKKDWLNLTAFFAKLDTDPDTLAKTLEDGLANYHEGRVSEQQKGAGLLLGAIFIAAGAICYAAIGYNDLGPIVEAFSLFIAAPIVAVFIFGTVARWRRNRKTATMEKR